MHADGHAHFLAVPNLATPTHTFGVDDASSTATAPVVFAHVQFLNRVLFDSDFNCFAHFFTIGLVGTIGKLHCQLVTTWCERDFSFSLTLSKVLMVFIGWNDGSFGNGPLVDQKMVMASIFCHVASRCDSHTRQAKHYFEGASHHFTILGFDKINRLGPSNLARECQCTKKHWLKKTTMHAFHESFLVNMSDSRQVYAEIFSPA